MSVYFARCDNSALTFLECTKNGGKLIASIVEVYRVDPNSQTVIRVGYGGAGLYKFHSCTVADRASWSCMYNDGSAKIDLSQGQYSEFSSSEIKMKEIKLRGQVSYAQYRSLYNPW